MACQYLEKEDDFISFIDIKLVIKKTVIKINRDLYDPLVLPFYFEINQLLCQ